MKGLAYLEKSTIKEAIVGYIAALKEDGFPVPEEHFEVLVAVV